MDETSMIKPGKSDDPERLVKMAEISVRPTEQGYVTATSLQYKTFFVQQCKYTNEDLVKHNKQIHEYCKLLCGGGNKVPPEHIPREVKVGDVFCTRFPIDNNWYRSVVKTCDNEKSECQVYFVDYGNYETVSYNDLLQVNPKNMPAIECAPYGFHCTLKGSEKLDDANTQHLLNCVADEYVLFRVKERLDVDHWCVELPKLAYNTTFWITYQSGKDNKNKTSAENSPQPTTKVDAA